MHMIRFSLFLPMNDIIIKVIFIKHVANNTIILNGVQYTMIMVEDTDSNPLFEANQY